MFVKCLNGDLFEIENIKDTNEIKKTISNLRPEWDINYSLHFIPWDNKDFLLRLDPKLQLDAKKERLNDYCYRYTIRLFYQIEDEEVPFHSFCFYKNYSTTDQSKRYPIYGFGTNKYILSYWGNVKEMIENIRYRVCTGVYPEEKKEVWDVIVENIHLFENNLYKIES